MSDLKRFSQERYSRKITTLVNFPITSLDLSEFASEKGWYMCTLAKQKSFVLFDLGLTSLSTIFQSYRDGVWMWQGAQCSLLECCLIEISRPRHFDIPPSHIILTLS